MMDFATFTRTWIACSAFMFSAGVMLVLIRAFFRLRAAWKYLTSKRIHVK